MFIQRNVIGKILAECCLPGTEPEILRTNSSSNLLELDGVADVLGLDVQGDSGVSMTCIREASLPGFWFLWTDIHQKIDWGDKKTSSMSFKLELYAMKPRYIGNDLETGPTLIELSIMHDGVKQGLKDTVELKLNFHNCQEKYDKPEILRMLANIVSIVSANISQSQT